ncbi:MAG: hypothetical protein IT373_31875 [Polyangiaceae bacterium]|nr:hypothetical protein [Polyangiaceae bacterium]
MAKTANKPQTKADFTLAHPDTPAKELVAKAKAAGFALTEKYIYTTRSLARARKERDERRARAGVSGPSGASSPVSGLLLAVAAEIGLQRAIELLEAERKRVVAMLQR